MTTSETSQGDFTEEARSDLRITCDQLTVLVGDIKAIYTRFLANQIDIHNAREEIKSLLRDHEKILNRDKTNIVSLFPDDLPFIHINQTYFTLSSSYEHQVNLNITLTPSSSRHRTVILVYPNVVVNDTLSDLSPLQYSIRPIFKGRDVTYECLVTRHHVDWSYNQCKSPLQLRVHPGDKIIFHARDGLDYTITSTNSQYEIPINPTYDLTILAGNRVEIILNKPGDYYFVSRPHKKYLRLYVHVKNCPYH